jgi:DNA-binding CsgD family transcriptional regulator
MKRRRDYVAIPQAVLEQMYYGEGLTQREIGEIFGVTGGTIRHRMVEYGLDARTAQDYLRLDIPKTELERLYVEEGRPAPEIAAMLGCATSAVYRYMNIHGIPVRPNGSDKIKRIVPPDKLVWSPEFAYVVGLIASDGSLQTGVNEVRFASTDRELADHYCRCLGLRPDDVSAEQWPEANAPQVHMRIEDRPPYKKQWHIIFSDFAYRARLEEIGLMPQKSRTLGSLNVPDEYFRDFLRGEFDGDGCWSRANYSNGSSLLGIFTSGSRTFLEWLRDTLRRLAAIEKCSLRGIDLRYNGKAAEQLGRFLYYQPGLPCLSRKRDKWEAWMIENGRDPWSHLQK